MIRLIGGRVWTEKIRDGKEFGGVRIIVCVDNRMGMSFNHRRVSRDRVVSGDILEMVRGNVFWMAPGAEKLFEEALKEKVKETDGGKKEPGCEEKTQAAGKMEAAKMWKTDPEFLTKAGAEDFCFVEGENLTGYEGKITEIVLYRWNRDYPADLFFEVDLSKWKLEERKEFSGYSHEKITREIYRQG